MAWRGGFGGGCQRSCGLLIGITGSQIPVIIACANPCSSHPKCKTPIRQDQCAASLGIITAGGSGSPVIIKPLSVGEKSNPRHRLIKGLGSVELEPAGRLYSYRSLFADLGSRTLCLLDFSHVPASFPAKILLQASRAMNGFIDNRTAV